MKPNAWLGMGSAGAAVSAPCCFAPALRVLPGISGLSVAVGMLEFVLPPALRSSWR